MARDCLFFFFSFQVIISPPSACFTALLLVESHFPFELIFQFREEKRLNFETSDFTFSLTFSKRLLAEVAISTCKRHTHARQIYLAPYTRDFQRLKETLT